MPKQAKRTQSPAGTCIFCGRTGLSKEHVWSDWLREVVPGAGSYYWGRTSIDILPDKSLRVTRPFENIKKQGSMQQRKLRNVCKSYCNNGWMSRVVQDAKPIAKQLILGQTCQLTDSEMKSLAAWIAITAIMLEFASTHVNVIEPKDRIALMETKVPPDSWTIWIGCYGGKKFQPMGSIHAPKLYKRLADDTLAGSDAVPLLDLQHTTFAIKQLLVHVVTCPDPEIVPGYRDMIEAAGFNLVRLWPIMPITLKWPRFPIFDGELAKILSEWDVKYGTPIPIPGFGLRRQI